ncbi:MAG TPA: HAMP domain-containing sensor histidine kinase [Actinomycetes bacterium]|nr:HAMP domain-containing sensor histidine kinase [Actinomycetes bacterium]
MTPRTIRRPFSGWSLRTRLIAGLLALLAVVSVVIGVVSVVSLDRFLMHRLDQQVLSAANRSNNCYGNPAACGRGGSGGGGPDPDGDDGARPVFLDAPGQAVGTLGVRIVDGAVADSGVVTAVGDPARTVESSATEALLGIPVDGRVHTVDLGGTLGDYRVVAVRMPDGDVLVTGLPLSDVQTTVYQLAAVVTAVGVLGLVLAALLGILIVRLALRPLRRVAATASRVAELPLDRGEVALRVRVPAEDTDPRTEVGQVGAALNRMLDHVAAALAARQASEMRVRHFVADASHELRTPLAAIRGYAELTRPRRAELPEDVGHALERVESESVRMTGLVEDLLLLARLDAGRPVDQVPVDLSALLVDAVSDAHAAGPDHHWELDLPEEPMTVPGDAARLHQVAANLLANARTHTPPGTRVRVGLLPEAGQAVLTVSDDGPGIPPALLPDVFERFARGDGSRSRAAGSTGLGLAIVAAVVEAHGGAVEVRSRPGETVFTVRLPLAPPVPATAPPEGLAAGVPAEKSPRISEQGRTQAPYEPLVLREGPAAGQG